MSQIDRIRWQALQCVTEEARAAGINIDVDQAAWLIERDHQLEQIEWDKLKEVGVSNG